MVNSPSFARLLLAPLLLVAACKHHKPAVVTSSPASMKQLEGTWLASHEENRGDTLVYRPNTYKFPPARGRTGFAIRSFGRFEQFDIAPADGLVGHPGTWTADGTTHLIIHLTDGHEPNYTLEILSLNNNVLKLRRVK
ncbi:hypothetical protein GCM10028822_17500 [Hymenobacter terrigena]